MQRRILKPGATLVAVLLVAGACSGAGGSSTESGEITLELPSWQANDGNFENWLRPLVEEFNEEHDGITVNLQHSPMDGFADQMTTRFAAGDPPEIVHLPAVNFAEFAENGWFESLDERLSETDILETWTDLQEEMVWDEEHQGVLLLGAGRVLFYNQAMFDEAGIDVPTTPEELVDAAERLTEGDVYGFGFTTAQHPPRNYVDPTDWVVGYGSHWANADAATASSAETTQAIETLREALEYAPQGVTSQQRFELFSQGRIAMMVDGPFLIPEIEAAPEDIRDDLQVARAPFEHTPGGASNGFHIPSGLDPDVEDAVWTFIEYATTPEWQLRYVEELGVPAPREGVITEEILENQPRLETIQIAADEAVPMAPPSPELRANFGRLETTVGNQMIRMMTTTDETSEILDDLNHDLEEIFDLAID